MTTAPPPGDIDPRVLGQRGLRARFVANGVEPVEVDEILASITRWEDWPATWERYAHAHRERGNQALAQGRNASALQAFLLASATYHFGCYLSSDDAARYRSMGMASADAYRRALPLMAPPGHSLEIPFDHSSIHAWLRAPAGGGNPPLVILIPGLDARKEELHALGQAIVDRGMAALGVDGPGQGEAEFDHAMQADFGRVVEAVLSALPATPPTLGLLGVSLGGYWAPQAAARLGSRVDACVAICGPFHWANSWADLVPLQKRVFATKTRQPDHAAAGEHARRFSLEQHAAEIRCPLLVVHAGRDTVILPSEGEALAAAVPHARLVIYDDATHVCHNRHWLMRPLVADWLAAELTA